MANHKIMLSLMSPLVNPIRKAQAAKQTAKQCNGHPSFFSHLFSPYRYLSIAFQSVSYSAEGRPDARMMPLISTARACISSTAVNA